MEPFLAQIIMFGGNFAPRGWAFCDGQILPISQNQALFSLLGTTYGGDGRTTFALPDLRGRFPMHPGNGPGLSTRRLGEKSGSETRTLVVQNLPAHSHNLRCNNGTADSDTPVNGFPAVDEGATESYHTSANDTMGSPGTANTGNNTPFNIVNPYLGVNFIIALQGIYPSRS